MSAYERQTPRVMRCDNDLVLTSQTWDKLARRRRLGREWESKGRIERPSSLLRERLSKELERSAPVVQWDWERTVGHDEE